MLVTVITTNHSFLLWVFVFIFHKTKCHNTLSEILASRLQMTFFLEIHLAKLKYAVKVI